MPPARQRCPICSAPVRVYPRYPRYACADCVGEARSADGRPLVFYNIDMSGGYRAKYGDDGQPYEGHDCFIRGIRCVADEARFGGIVIQAVSATPPADGGANAPGTRSDRARGVLVGLALGDALGAPVEFDAPDAIVGRREYVFSMPGGGPFDWAPGEFTDDTQMALVLARQLRDRDRLDQDELARAFAVWAQDAADVGNQTRTVLDAVSGGHAWQNAIQRLAPDAAGNGSLMRVAPVALVATSGDIAARLGEDQSVITHPNALCVAACRVFARLLWTAIETGEVAFAALASWTDTAGVRDAIERSAAAAPPAMSGYVLHTLTGALWAVRHADSFEDAVWRAVALGRDADTVAAIAGGLAGARWGLAGIPSSLSSRLQSNHPLFRDDYPDALERLADELSAKRARLQSTSVATPMVTASAQGHASMSEDKLATCERLISSGLLQDGPWLRRAPQPLAGGQLPTRIRGMLLGVAIGDALGNTTESMHPLQRLHLHGEIRDYLPNRHAGGRTVGLPSDDTQLTFRTLELLLDEGRLSQAGLLHRFASSRVFGAGSATREALAAFVAGELGSAGVRSAGNGALMRITPVLLPYLRAPGADLWLDTVLATAATHGDSMALASSVAWVDLLWTLLASTAAPAPELWFDRVIDIAREVESPVQSYRARGGAFESFEGTLSEYLQRCRSSCSQEPPVLEACQRWYSGAYLLETLPSVLYILSRHADDPEEALVRAVNDTWDNDTIASIVGGAVGALHGPGAFPSRWSKNLLGRTRADDEGRVFALIDRAVDAFAT